MSEQESKLSNYIDYPYDRFLKLRIEFLILTQSDLKARIMRLIERCVENERANIYRNACNSPRNKNKQVEVPDGIFAAISHKFFMDEMWGTVQSETTVRDALKELEADHLIIRRPGGSGPYDPPLYTLNKPLIEHLFNMLPALNEIDMLTLMKPPRKKKLEDGTIDPGTIIDPLAKLIRDTIIGPLDPQLLDPYPPIIGPLSRSRGVQLLDPKRYTETLEENKKEESIGSSERNAFVSLENLSLEELQAELIRRNALPTTEPELPAIPDVPVQPKAPTQSTLLGDVPIAAPHTPTKSKAPAKLTNGLTPEGQHVREWWEAQTKRKLSTSLENVKALNGLGEIVTCSDDFNEVRQAMKDDPYYVDKNIRVTPDLMYRKYDGFMDRVDKKREALAKRREQEERQKQLQVPGSPVVAGTRQLTELEIKNREMKARFSRQSTASA